MKRQVFEKIMFLFTLSLLLAQTISLNIAYLGQSTDDMFTRILTPYQNNNAEITFEAFPITNSDYKDVLQQIVNKGIDVAFANCQKETFEWESPVLSNNQMLIWCINTESVGRCKKPFISGISVIPFIENSIIIIIIIILS